MPGIGVVLNPKSRHNLRDPAAAARLAKRLGDQGVVREARSIDDLYRIAEDFRRDAVDVLAIHGGDGTNTVTLSGFVDVYGETPLPALALLRGGTMNTAASSVGVPAERPDVLLERLALSYTRRADSPLTTTERTLMRVAALDPPGASAPRPQYAFIFGTGVVHGFLAEYYGAGETSPLVAASTLLRGMGSAFVGGATIRRMAAPFRGRVRLGDGTEWPERDYLAVAAGTIPHIGLGFQPFHRMTNGAVSRSVFEALGIYASPASFVVELGRVHAGQPMRAGKAYEALSTRMVVEGSSGSVRYTVDGELQDQGGAVEVTAGPRVRIVIP